MADSWKTSDSEECEHCGAELIPNAKMCRSCGADASCGWGDESFNSEWQAEDDFDYDDFVAREFPEEMGSTVPGKRDWVRFVMLLLIVSLLFSMVL